MSTKIKSNVQGVINFNTLLDKKDIGISQIDQQDLSDISLQLNIRPATDPLMIDHILMSADDVHIYLNDIDFTKEYQAALIENLNSKNSSDIKKQYNDGINHWLKILNKFNFDGINIAAERIKGDHLVDKNYTELLTKLGSIDQGRSGGLHIFNFLYDYIKISPVSFNSLISKKYPGDPAKQTVNDFVPLKLTISHGKLNSDGLSESANIRGQLNYLIDLIYENPLYDLMFTISNQIKEIKKNMETQRIMYYDKMVNSMQTLEQDTKLKFSDLNTLFTKLEDDINKILPK